MSRIESFALQAGADPRVLVLGSIPGVASLQAVQYYAHPRNAFWPIMADYFSFESDAEYDTRLQILREQGVALWDVLQSCVRSGSLDSAIEAGSIAANPIEEWLAEQPQVKLILLNGGKAAEEFRRRFPNLMQSESLTVLKMPSTSPAYAAMRFEAKAKHWHAALDTVY